MKSMQIQRDKKNPTKILQVNSSPWSRLRVDGSRLGWTGWTWLTAMGRMRDNLKVGVDWDYWCPQIPDKKAQLQTPPDVLLV